MKIFGAAVLALSCMPSASAFVTPKVDNKQFSQLSAKKDGSGWFAPVASAVAGLTIASQVAGAALPVNEIVIENASPVMQQVESTSSSTISGSSMYLSGGDDVYMDFSMPSYGSSVDSPAKAKPDAPSFSNPFKDFDMAAPKADEAPAALEATIEDKVSAEVKKAEEKAAAEAKKAEEKAAAEARKAEEKAEAEARKAAEKAEKEAAAEAKKAEKEAAEAKKKEEEAAAAAKKAEKEARRQAELEKQREAVQRAKEAEEEKKAAVTVAAPPAPAPAPAAAPAPAPEPKLEIPEFKAPDIKVPDFSFSVPKVDIPKVEMPKVEAPSATFEMPKTPSFAVPSGGYDLSTSKSAVDENIEPQEVRDERAKVARNVYKEADESAKEMEKKAAELRSVANEKKKLAKEAKDEACETRLGGKLICIRPINSGY